MRSPCIQPRPAVGSARPVLDLSVTSEPADVVDSVTHKESLRSRSKAKKRRSILLELPCGHCPGYVPKHSATATLCSVSEQGTWSWKFLSLRDVLIHVMPRTFVV